MVCHALVVTVVGYGVLLSRGAVWLFGCRFWNFLHVVREDVKVVELIFKIEMIFVFLHFRRLAFV